jgi:glycosyltransferase involved in cell wall biosynthesis
VSSIRLMNVVPTLLCGGTENHFMTLSRSLAPDQFDQRFACLRRWGPFVTELMQRQVPLVEYRVKTFRSVNALVQQARLARYIRQHAIQIVHTYSFYGNVFAVPPARFAAPVVIASIRDRAPYLTGMQKRVQRHVCRLADRVLVNAEAVKTWLVGDGYDPNNIVVIPNGVDLTKFTQPVDRAEVRRSLGVPDDAPLVAVVSRLSRLKGIEDFLHAAAVVGARHTNARFAIVGEPSPIKNRAYLDELGQLANRLGIGDRVLFTGLRSDVPAVLQSVDVSVMPSLNEALSNVLLESMAAGAPIVATEVGGTSEALTDGENGLLVQPNDPAAMAAAITRLLDHPELAQRLGHRAQATIEQRFSLARMVAATEHLYHDLLDQKQRKKAA